MENYLPVCIRSKREALLISVLFAEICDMGHHDVCRLAVELVILSPEGTPDMRCEADVDDYVLLAGVVVHGNAAEESEAVAGVDVI